ncbi:MAG: hypothetical protein NW207_00220 [Cytophagales bacterium]|nr:hypothetical protein [Cytophagales bacterium]
MFIFSARSSYAQKSQGIGTPTPNPRAVLDIAVENPATFPQGLLIPRLNTTNRATLTAALSAAAKGMMIYDTDENILYTWDGAAWVAAGSNWGKNSSDLFYMAGNVGIGTPAPFGFGMFVVSQTGSSASASFFTVANATNSSSAVYAITNGTGRAIQGTIFNAANSNSAIFGTTNGTGSAGEFSITNNASTATSLRAAHTGTGLVGEFVGSGGVIISSDLTVGGLGGAAGSIVTVDGAGKLGYGTLPSPIIDTKWNETGGDKIYTTSFVGIGETNPINLFSIKDYNISGSPYNSVKFDLTQGGGASQKYGVLYNYSVVGTGSATNRAMLIDVKGNSSGTGVTGIALNFSMGVGSAPLTGIITNIPVSNAGDKTGADIQVTGTGGATNVGIRVNATGAANNYPAIFNGGNVGIGTNTPTASLHINGGLRVENLSVSGSVLTVDGAGNVGLGSFPAITPSWQLGGNTSPSSNTIGSTDTPFRIISNNQEAMFLNNFGQVGIGTTASGAKLEVNSNGQTSLKVTAAASGGGAPAVEIIHNSTGFQGRGLKVGTDGTEYAMEVINTGFGQSGIFRINNSTNTNTAVIISHNSTSTGKALDVTGAIKFSSFSISGSVLTVDGAGNIGLGSLPAISPSWQLGGNTSPSSNTIGSTDTPFRIIANNNEGMFINNFGEVGIGTTASGTKFHVYNGTGTAIIATGAGSASPVLSVSNVNMGMPAPGADFSSSGFQYTLRATNYNAGIVGEFVSTSDTRTNPVVKITSASTTTGKALEVIGGVKLNSYSISGSVLTVDGAGNVGLGAIPTGSNDWTIVGNNLRPVVSTYNIQVPSISGALMIGTSTGLRMNDNNSIFLGNNSGNTTTTGLNNIFFGPLAGNRLTTGYNNFAMGDATGRNITSGFNNFLYGENAGFSINTGTNNNVIGFGAGYFMTNGNHNNFLGYFSGRATTNGSHNNMFGNGAGERNTTGSRNNMLGQDAGNNNTTGFNNNFFGFNSGLDNISGYNNIFIGTYSGIGNTAGFDNIAIGQRTGFTSNNLSNAIAIGALTSATGSNQVVIGNNITGLGINTAPTAMLDVNGSIRVRNLSISGSVLTVDGSGNVGMGVISAGVPSGVANSIPFYNSSATFTTSTTLGWDEKKLSINDGYIFITSTGTNSSVMIGKEVGNTTFTGINNNFIGYKAGESITTGFLNNFFGSNAGRSNTTGQNNNFFGQASGYSNQFGSNNNFIGGQAGYSNVSGNSNNFMGYFAGFSNNGGTMNNFIGINSGYSNTNGEANNFMGRNAGYNNLNGSFNNFIGFMAGNDNTYGTNNIFIGSLSGIGNIDGNENIAIGINSGTSNKSNVIVIGNHVSASASNQMILGAPNGAYVITGVGIGTDAPTAKLDVQGSIRFRNLNSPGSILTVDGLGNLGVGTISVPTDTRWINASPERFYTSSLVGIGETFPNVPLVVRGTDTNTGSVLNVKRDVTGANGLQVGVQVDFNGTQPSGSKISYNSSIVTTGNEGVRGMSSTITNNSSVQQMNALYSYITNNGPGQSVALTAINDGEGAGNHTGVFIQDNSTGNGEHYGVSANILAISGGSNYAIYGNATGSTATGIAGNFAGYFENGKVYIQNNLGLGTADPTAKLDVQGTIRFRNLNTPGSVLTVDGLGNVGMAPFTSSTSQDWSVAGQNMFSLQNITGLGIGTTTFDGENFVYIKSNGNNGSALFVESSSEQGAVWINNNSTASGPALYIDNKNISTGTALLINNQANAPGIDLTHNVNTNTNTALNVFNDALGKSINILQSNTSNTTSAIDISNGSSGSSISISQNNNSNTNHALHIDNISNGRALNIQHTFGNTTEPGVVIFNDAINQPALVINQIASVSSVPGLKIDMDTPNRLGLEVLGGVKLKNFSISGSVLTVDGSGNLGIGSIGGTASQWITTTDGIYTSSLVGIGELGPVTGVKLMVAGSDNDASMALFHNSNATQAGSIIIAGKNGNLTATGAPAAMLQNQKLGGIGFGGYDGTDYMPNGPTAEITAIATQNFSTGSNGTAMEFKTTPNGSNNSLSRMILSEDGKLSINTTSGSSFLNIYSGTATGLYISGSPTGSVVGVATIETNSSQTGALFVKANVPNSVGLYTEAKGIDATGIMVEANDDASLARFSSASANAEGVSIMMSSIVSTSTGLKIFTSSSVPGTYGLEVNNGDVKVSKLGFTGGGVVYADNLGRLYTSTLGGAGTIWSSSGINTYLFDQSNRVGIGTSLPSAKLQIVNDEPFMPGLQINSNTAAGLNVQYGGTGIGANFTSSDANAISLRVLGNNNNFGGALQVENNGSSPSIMSRNFGTGPAGQFEGQNISAPALVVQSGFAGSGTAAMFSNYNMTTSGFAVNINNNSTAAGAGGLNISVNTITQVALNVNGLIRNNSITANSNPGATYPIAVDPSGTFYVNTLIGMGGPWSVSGGNIINNPTGTNVLIGTTTTTGARLNVNGDVALGTMETTSEGVVVVYLHNPAAMSRNKGDIVVVGASDNSFDYTASGTTGDNSVIGVLYENCPLNTTCRVAISGIVKVNVNSPVIRGQHVICNTSVNPGMAVSTPTPNPGSSIGVFLQSSSGPDARALLR